VIEVQELYKYYGDRRAVGPLSTQIEKGEVIGLLGLNGAGKTTTLRVLACDLLPTSGTVKVGGFDVVEEPGEVRRRTGYLPDVPPLYGDMSVFEYLSFAAKLRGVSSADVDKRVGEAVEMTQLGKERNRLISALSHGFKQRVGIAQAIVHKPEFVVLDEPISGLDPAQIVEMRDLVRGLRGNHTVVLSSHILSEISETCDRILVIRDGEIVASGTEKELAMRQQTMRIDVTVRAATDDAADKARALLQAITGVASVEIVDPSEDGTGIASFEVRADKDVRDQVGKQLVESGLGLLQLARSERELESVFLELSGSSTKGEVES
jgi:ABC-2 type transport system ATP-binding protein